jgi:general secretion pathway protein I
MPAPGKAGFSLIELLVAMTLFAIAALGLSAGVAIVSRSGVLSDHLTRATILAQDKLEELASHNAPLAGGADTPHSGFTREWTVSPDDPDAGVMRVDVTVTWEGSGVHSISLATVVNE